MSKSLLRTIYRYVVTYQDSETGDTKTFSVEAATASIATARTISYIEDNKLHEGDFGYTLIPRVSKQKTDYEIQ